MQRSRILSNINTSAIKQNEIATETLNINTSAMKQNESATETLNINTSAMKQNEIATETLNINTSAMKQTVLNLLKHDCRLGIGKDRTARKTFDQRQSVCRSDQRQL